MKIHREPSLTALAWRSLLGPSMIADGAVATLTLGSCTPGLSMKVAKRLSRARLSSRIHFVDTRPSGAEKATKIGA